MYTKTANINAVEPQQRQPCRKAARGLATGQFKHFVHVQRLREFLGRALAPGPVVEVARDDQWRSCGDQSLNTLAQFFKLA